MTPPRPPIDARTLVWLQRYVVAAFVVLTVLCAWMVVA